MPDPTNEKKFKFLKSVYYGVTNNPKDDVNPFTNVDEFGHAPVGVLRWGEGTQTRQHSKIRFSHNYYKVLKHYKVILPIENIFGALDDDMPNDDVVMIWVTQATFN